MKKHNFSFILILGFFVAFDLSAMQIKRDADQISGGGSEDSRDFKRPKTVQPETHITDLPDDSLVEIFKNLTVQDLGRASGSCHRFNRVAGSVQLKGFDHDSVEFRNLYDNAKQEITARILSFPSSFEELDAIQFESDDDFYELVANLIELFFRLDNWRNTYSLSTKIFPEEESAFERLFDLYKNYATARGISNPNDKYDHFRSIIEKAIQLNYVNATNYAINYCEHISVNQQIAGLELDDYYDWLENASLANSLDVVRYFIALLNKNGINTTEYFNEIDSESSKNTLDILLTYDKVSNDVIKIYIMHGVRPSLILNGNENMAYRDRYFRCLNELGLNE